MPPAKSGAAWVDVVRPSAKDVAELGKKFGIHPLILDELKHPSARAKVERHGDYLYLVYYFPLYDETEEFSERSEIDIVVTRDAVITVHEDAVESFENVKQRAGQTSLELLHSIILSILRLEERQIRHIREKVEAIGKELFLDHEKEVLSRLSRVKRDISEYRIIARLQEPILRSLAAHGSRFWGEDDAQVYLNDLLGDQLRLMSELDDYRDAISDFEDTNNQLMNLKINEVMKTFTILSFLTFPFVLIAALFSMNTPGMPGINFWALVGSMAVVMLALTYYFRNKGWF